MQDHTPASSLDNAIALQKYGVGQPVRRKEDDTLVRGKGKYTDDFTLPGQAYCWMVRSSHAHGIIKGIDTAAAKAMPGVLGVWTGKDLEGAGYSPFTCGLPLKSRDGSPLLQTNRPALATDKVRFVGDPIAFVVAETLAQARDAAEAVELDIEPLPAVTDAAEAAKPGATITSRTMLRLIITMATARRSMPRLLLLRMSQNSTSSTPALPWCRWSRAWRWRPSTRRPNASRCRCRRRASPATR